MGSTLDMQHRIDLDSPRWDQSTFAGRLRHFFWMTDPRTALVSTSRLYEARDLVLKYKAGQEPPGTTEEEVWYAKKLYTSAFHPDSGELQNVIGRMSFQVPGGMLLTGCMLQFYKTNSAVVFWQWMNQSFNALVNYTNRNAESDLTTKKIMVAYVSATTCALVTALGLKGTLARRAPPMVQRFVPFVAVASANVVNIPLMRQSELTDGIAVFDENGNKITESRYAAVKGISQVVASRIVMAAPGMTLLPFLMEYLEKFQWMQRMKAFHAPLQVLLCGAFLTFMTPTACALFPQRCSITTDKLSILDGNKLSAIRSKYGPNTPKILYFNKGL
ncbi:sideroflexin-2-like [Liolophura sinensis]|uniref:sideroflexin-2-like n=1 Tax=Liolophura sinensis TaxID=3198878 RepID=UPI00315951A3